MKIVNLRARDLGPHEEGLRALERDILYPIADGRDRFYIDHGEHYGEFFSSLASSNEPDYTGFLLALDGDRVVATLGGIRREARLGDRTVASLYLADYKIAASHRGRGVGRALMRHGLTLFRYGIVREAKIFYGAAMRGERGDVMRSARGFNRIMRLARPTAELSVYFVAPERLAKLDVKSAPPPPRGVGLDLSPNPSAIVSTAGRKDLRLISTGKPWPLHHLPRSPASAFYPSYLARCGEELSGVETSCCFALDPRLDAHVAWLAAQGIERGARCTVYAMRLPGARGRVDWVHLATSEI